MTEHAESSINKINFQQFSYICSFVICKIQSINKKTIHFSIAQIKILMIYIARIQYFFESSNAWELLFRNKKNRVPK